MLSDMVSRPLRRSVRSIPGTRRSARPTHGLPVASALGVALGLGAPVLATSPSEAQSMVRPEILDPFASRELTSSRSVSGLIDPFFGVPVRSSGLPASRTEILDPFSGPGRSAQRGELIDPWDE